MEALAQTESEAKELTVEEQHLGRLIAAVLRASRKDEWIRRLDAIARQLNGPERPC
jgi:hypothetical protein